MDISNPRWSTHTGNIIGDIGLRLEIYFLWSACECSHHAMHAFRKISATYEKIFILAM